MGEIHVFWLGLLLVALAGFCSCFIGVVVSVCAKNNINYNIVQALGSVLALITGVVILAFKMPEDVPFSQWLLVFLLSSGAGIANYFTFYLTELAMKKGPNGLIWSIMQSGMIGSFLMGVFVFGEKASLLRWVSLAVIICGVILSGLGKKQNDQKSADSSLLWLWLSLGAALLVAATHCLLVLPSFIPGAAATGTVFRSISVCFGVLITFAVTMLPQALRERGFHNKGVWIVAVICTVINCVHNFLLFFNGVDLLTQCNSGGLGYPVNIGICLVGFSLYSLIFLREKFSIVEYTGVICITAGVIGISLG